MKKQFLTFALLATVAVGGAFATNLHSRLVTEGSPLNTEEPCAEPQPIDGGLNCSPTFIGAQCTINGGTPAYVENPETGKCALELYRSSAN